ncbi:bifunctional metallophosphatase/5'-nucleotidase (plasmid) [Deinococcus metallilatus]|uniref:5'-nucleotidase n=1 Tax=Deinococcus metallilatus TaxID=1211322 RepID=A0AAJ5F5S4_9DEIO|nr:bifunctional metallophosphatase/5'-nucleotidase [Deinococcus metallilatus]MBB5293320.1 5'-nucleotidase [Deinococcus metallilatus]QBY06427.1 bifunctional metallophosphatase/5'-nucleotidase [Deinococcus metallilatus]RXJ18106.1 bifunctional metallophosphatase/5'-nucleotidase [Deinococcus metallilatus]TLK32042.1 bifunctional metallophosphatase/5'-nucleotidase [Deinococcus metallilatus]GMA15457.1 multifunctional 2',3'-cyclic-nucleotide 2'-phosphodiesterase/5'-nucleotidase/3'-nucleotidase [Deinoc
MKNSLMFITLALGLTACVDTTPPDQTLTPEPVNVTVMAVNDFHGGLEPSSFAGVQVPNADGTGTTGLTAGGIEAIGGELADVRKQNPNTVFVGGGDLIGASPVTSSLLRDEPTVIALSKLGLKASALGNHEFDQGLKELMRMQNGGCDSNAPDKACKFDPNYPGASFRWLGANVEYKAGGTNPFQPYYIENIGGAKIGFIGAVLKDTPTIVSPTGVADLNFLDEATSINKYVPILKAQKVDAILVLIHQGGEIKAGSAAKFDTVGCQDLIGDIVPIAQKIDPAVSAIISGHTHQGYNCLVPDPNGKPRIVIEGEVYGHLLQRLDLVVDKANHNVMQVKAQNVVINYASRKANGTLDSNMTALLATAKAKTDDVKNQFVTNLSVSQIKRAADRSSESALGDVIADAQLTATKAQGAQIAFMNPGGIRADLPDSTKIKPGNVVNFGDVFAVQPFGNTMVVMDLTGAQIKALLEQQTTGNNAGTNAKLLQVSAGFSYTLNLTAPEGARVSNLKLNGQALADTASYRVAMNSFLSTGGDNFTVFKQGTNVVQLPGLVDVDALVSYLKANGPSLTGTVQGRITVIK